jgi:GTP cyclohydrolase I
MLPDIQKTNPEIFMPINQVGVENVEVPFKIQLKNMDEFYETIANVSIRTNLDKNTKGISMSRLLLTLKDYLNKPLKSVLIKNILEDIKKNVGSSDAYIKFNFRFPTMRKSILSEYEFPVYHKCFFEGQLIDNIFTFYQGITYQYASYCPCSTELCNDLKNKGEIGSPHAQRSFAKIVIESCKDEYIWLEDIFDVFNLAIKTLPYPIIKRIDEQEIARIAAYNPIFVEDAIRLISNELNKDNKIKDWIIKCIHEESIHTSEAIAICFKGMKNGFDDKYFI